MKREVVAYHEAGHAVVAHWLGIRVKDATIKETDSFAGRMTHGGVLTARDLRLIENFKVTPYTRDRMEKLAMICLAGPLAQRRYSHRSKWRQYGSSDFERYERILLELAGGGKALRAYNQLLTAWTESKLEVHWPQIALVAAELLERETLSRDDLQQALQRPWQRKS